MGLKPPPCLSPSLPRPMPLHCQGTSKYRSEPQPWEVDLEVRPATGWLISISGLSVADAGTEHGHEALEPPTVQWTRYSRGAWAPAPSCHTEKGHLVPTLRAQASMCPGCWNCSPGGPEPSPAVSLWRGPAFLKPQANVLIGAGATQELPAQKTELGSSASPSTFWLCSHERLTYPLWPQCPHL